MESLTPQYNWTLVALSYLISVIGAYASLQLTDPIPGAKGFRLWAWLASAALAMGGGAIWSMHFIGMLAYQMPMKVTYDPGLTLGSLLIAVIASGVGLYLVVRGGLSLRRLLGAGTFMGIGVSGMHYSGMAAMRMPGTLSYRPGLFILSVLIGIAAATAALWIAFSLRRNMQRFASAFIMGVAVCGMHYTGMAAVYLKMDDNAPVISSIRGLAPETLGTSIFIGSFLLLSAALLVSLGSIKIDPNR